MKKWLGIAAILICCSIYAMVRLSISQYQDANTQEKEMPGAKQTDGGNTDEVVPEDDSGSPDAAVQTDRAAHEEDSGSPATVAQVEAVTKVFGEFLSALKSEDYEQAWKLTSKSLKSRVSFEEFKKEMPDMRAEILKSTIRPESATSIGGRVRVPITNPSHRDDHAFFVQEDGRWKLEM
jgi:hypothetical protein